MLAAPAGNFPSQPSQTIERLQMFLQNQTNPPMNYPPTPLMLDPSRDPIPPLWFSTPLPDTLRSTNQPFNYGTTEQLYPFAQQSYH